MQILLAQINPTVGDLKGNSEKIIHAITEGKRLKATIVLFPELCLSGYPPEDLLLLSHFLDSIETHLEKIREATENITAIVGLPRRNPSKKGKALYNSAAVISNQKILGFHDKVLLPTYDVFDERRYFEPGGEMQLFEIGGKKIAITICEDIWHLKDYHRDPIQELQAKKPEILLNLSASPYSVTKQFLRQTVCENAAKRLQCPLLFCNQVGANDSLIFDGHSVSIGKEGETLQFAKGFVEELMLVDFKKGHLAPIDETADLFHALVLGVRDYFTKQGFKQACLGLSGGIDSALVACIAKAALGKENVLAIAMPSCYSSASSVPDALRLAKNLGIAFKEIPIDAPFKSYMELLESPSGVTEENLQARIRGMILMATSNQLGYIVLSTGNKSELAMGYATLYGDMCGGLAVISDLTKRQVYALSHFINQDKEIIPKSTLTKAPSAELRENQKDSDNLPDYDIIDNVLQAYVEDHLSPDAIIQKFGYSEALVHDLISRIHRAEYKRRQSPPGLRVTEKAFSVGRHFPIVQKWH